jgi:hypothetical protein
MARKPLDVEFEHEPADEAAPKEDLKPWKYGEPAEQKPVAESSKAPPASSSPSSETKKYRVISSAPKKVHMDGYLTTIQPDAIIDEACYGTAGVEVLRLAGVELRVIE